MDAGTAGVVEEEVALIGLLAENFSSKVGEVGETGGAGVRRRCDVAIL